MALQQSVAVRNARLDGEGTAIGASPILRLYTGAAPVNCAAAASGTQLASITLPATPFGAASNGVKSMAGSWSGTAGAAGNAGHWRIYDSAGTTCHMQGPAGQNADAWTVSTAYSSGAKVANGGNIYQCVTAGTSASSGGPTGTGNNITDGTATWNYVCPSASNGDPGMMALDNATLSNSQAVTVTSFAITAGNA